MEITTNFLKRDHENAIKFLSDDNLPLAFNTFYGQWFSRTTKTYTDSQIERLTASAYKNATKVYCVCPSIEQLSWIFTRKMAALNLRVLEGYIYHQPNQYCVYYFASSENIDNSNRTIKLGSDGTDHVRCFTTKEEAQSYLDNWIAQNDSEIKRIQAEEDNYIIHQLCGEWMSISSNIVPQDKKVVLGMNQMENSDVFSCYYDGTKWYNLRGELVILTHWTPFPSVTTKTTRSEYTPWYK